MKKLIITLIAALLMASLAFSVLADEQKPVYVTLNGNTIDCASYGQDATIVEGRTLVPLRAIFEALGATVEWEQSTKTVTSVLEDTTIKLTIGESVLYKDETQLTLDVPAMIMSNRTMVPARAVAEAFGVTVLWDRETRTVILLQDKYERGTINQNVYYSEYLDTKFMLPFGFEYSSEGELRRLMGIGEGVLEADIDFDSIKDCYEFIATDDNGCSVQLISSKKDSLMTSEEYLEELILAYNELGIDCKLSEVYTLELGENTYIVQDAEFDILGVELTQTVGICEMDTRFIIIMISSLSDEAKSAMIAGFGV